MAEMEKIQLESQLARAQGRTIKANQAAQDSSADTGAQQVDGGRAGRPFLKQKWSARSRCLRPA